MEHTMKKIIYLILILLAVGSGLVAQVNGELSQMGNNWILQTWGTHQQRGYAQGYLLSQPIMQIYQNYIFTILAMGNPIVYNSIVSFYLSSFTVEPKYDQEAQGIIDGMQAAGTDLYISALGRQLNKDDILTFNCIVDLHSYFSSLKAIGGSAPGCASLSSWGTSTQADSLLNGNVVISRLLDWDQDATLIANPLMIVSHPSEPDEQKWISFTYPGLIGALSGISESGKSAYLNMGNVHSYNNITGLHPILFSIRNAIESDDYNNDGFDDITDVYNAVSAGLSLSGTIIHAVSEDPITLTGVIETNNSLGTVMRTVLNNDTLPGMHLAATNHFRLLSSPVCCTRYANIVDSLTVNPFLSAKRQLTVLKGAAGMDNNMMAIQYIPTIETILWSSATLAQPAYMNQMITLDTGTLFGYNTSVAEEIQPPAVSLLKVYPNPAKVNSLITIENKDKTTLPLEVYNLKGQKIRDIESSGDVYRWDGINSIGKPAGAGIYLVKVRDKSQTAKTAKLLLLN